MTLIRAAPAGPRIGHRTPIPVFINRPNAEEIVVLRHPLHRESGYIPDRFRISPDRSGCVAPNDLVTRQIGFIVRVPVQLGIV